MDVAHLARQTFLVELVSRRVRWSHRRRPGRETRVVLHVHTVFARQETPFMQVTEGVEVRTAITGVGLRRLDDRVVEVAGEQRERSECSRAVVVLRLPRQTWFESRHSSAGD